MGEIKLYNVDGVNISLRRRILNVQAKTYHHGNLAAEILLRAAEVIDEDGIEALSLRGIARDLGVSHSAPNRHFKNKAALLSALATDGWLKVRDATLNEAEATGSDDPHVKLNAMGRGYLRWALNNRALFRAIYHPDVSRQASDELRGAIERFASTVRAAVDETQRDGRHPEADLRALTLFTNAVPTGAAVLLLDSMIGHEMAEGLESEKLIEEVINLVVPLPNAES